MATGRAEPFTARESYLAQVAGDRVVFNVKVADGVTLWSRPLTGGTEGPLAGMPKLGYDDAWAVTGEGVYFTSMAGAEHGSGSRPGPGPALWLHRFSDQTTRRLAALPAPPSPGGGLGMAVSREGRWLLYTRAGVAESDIMLFSAE